MKPQLTDRPTAPGITRLQYPARIRLAGLAVAAVGLAGLMIVSCSIGSRPVSPGDILAALGGATGSLNEAAVAKRIPRTLLAVLAGAALGLAGAVMQGVTRNPLADPGILGVNTGAALAVVTGIAWFGVWRPATTITIAVLGAGLAAVLVYVIGSLGRDGPTPLKLALAGTATSAALTSLISAVVLPRGDIAGSVRSWQIGGVGGAGYDAITQVLPVIAVGLVICLASARSLNTLALGDDVAASLGERVMLTRAFAALGAVLLCGATTAVCGPIGFVGLVVPHLCRLLIGPDHRWLLPFSALTGAGLLVAADVLGRIVARPAEIEVGIITALLGAPFFIFLIRRGKVRDL